MEDSSIQRIIGSREEKSEFLQLRTLTFEESTVLPCFLESKQHNVVGIEVCVRNRIDFQEMDGVVPQRIVTSIRTTRRLHNTMRESKHFRFLTETIVEVHIFQSEHTIASILVETFDDKMSTTILLFVMEHFVVS